MVINIIIIRRNKTMKEWNRTIEQLSHTIKEHKIHLQKK